MQISYTDRFLKSYHQAPYSIQAKFEKQAQFLVTNLRHPSLHAKKYDETLDIWRFYFQIRSGVIYLVDMMSHPK